MQIRCASKTVRRRDAFLDLHPFIRFEMDKKPRMRYNRAVAESNDILIVGGVVIQ